MSDRVGFFYQAFNQARATEAVLASVRKHYPTEPIFLCSDGGLDFRETAARHVCDYHYYPDSIGTKPLRDYEAYMNRLGMTCNYPVDWIVILEDDVCCRKQIEYWPSMEAAGPVGNEWSQNFKALCKTTNRGNVVSQYMCYGNCGGSILRCDALEASIKAMGPAIYDRACRADERFKNFTDAAITGTLQLAGFGYERWLEHSEESNGVFSPAGVGAFDHQYKRFYGQPQ